MARAEARQFLLETAQMNHTSYIRYGFTEYGSHVSRATLLIRLYASSATGASPCLRRARPRSGTRTVAAGDLQNCGSTEQLRQDGRCSHGNLINRLDATTSATPSRPSRCKRSPNRSHAKTGAYAASNEYMTDACSGDTAVCPYTCSQPVAAVTATERYTSCTALLSSSCPASPMTLRPVCRAIANAVTQQPRVVNTSVADARCVASCSPARPSRMMYTADVSAAPSDHASPTFTDPPSSRISMIVPLAATSAHVHVRSPSTLRLCRAGAARGFRA